jgi:filamentous hemagglutinin family protein
MSKTFKPKAAASLRRHALAGASAAALGWAVSTAALALPGTPTIFDSSGGVGVAATFTPGTGTLTIDQNHERVVIDWTSFDIAAGETVTFVQDQANWIAFNRVDVSTFTTIDGAITGAGSVWIFSPGGILFGANAQVNTGSFFAGTGDLDNFQANEVMGLSDASVFINYGLVSNLNTLTVDAGASITGTDFVILQGAFIDTAGDLVSSGGVGFLSSEGATIDFNAGSPGALTLTNISASWHPSGRGTPTFDHTGTTTAAWVDLQFGQLFQANYQQIINLDGVITATGTSSGLLNRPADTVLNVGGINSVTGLTGGRSVLLNVLGDLNATAGSVELQATDVFIVDGATVDAGVAFKTFTYGDITIQGDITAAGQITIHSQAENANILIESTAAIETTGLGMDISGNRDNATVTVFGELTAANNVLVRSKGDVYIGSTAILTGNSDDSVGPTNFGVFLQAGLGFDFTLQTMTSIGAGDVNVASGAVIDASAVNHPARVFMGANNGDVNMAGSVTGSRVTLVASDDIVVSGDITASEAVQIFAWAQSTPGIGGDITVSGQIVADDLITMWARYDGNVTIESGAVLISDADGIATTNIFGQVGDDIVWLTADASLEIESGATINAGANEVRLTSYGVDTSSTLSGAAMIVAGQIDAGQVYAYAYEGSIVVSGTVSVTDSADFYASDAFVLTSSGTINSDHTGSAFQAILSDYDYAGVFIESGDIAIAGQINSEIIAVHGLNDMVIGGVDGPANVGAYELGGEFNLSQVEFDNLNGSTIVIIGGDDSAVAESWVPVDITVQDLTVGATVDTLAIGTSSNNDINIVGVVAPQTPGGADLWIGFIQDDSGSVDGFIPGQINISGSIGTASNPFGAVNMLARYGIFMGSTDFIGIAQTDEDFNANLPNQIAVEEGHIFIASDVLTMASGGRIIQQNTGAEGEFAGLLIGEPQAGAELISVDPDLEGMVIGGPNGYTIAFEAGPDSVQLFGVLLGQAGQITGRDVSENPWLLSPVLASNVQYTINGCSFGGSPCGNASEVPQFETPTDIAVDDLDTTEELTAEEEQAAEEQAASEDQDSELFRSLVAPGSDRAYEQERIGEPITGSGNEDLWTGRGDGVRP